MIVEPQSPVWLGRITGFLSPMMEYLGELALAIILVVFMLQQREEFRNRVIRLVGYGRIAAGHQVRRRGGPTNQPFSAHASGRQRLVRSRAGLRAARLGREVRLALGLSRRAMLRYLPYIGPYLAAVLPVMTSLALNDGWSTTLLVIGLFLSLELLIANGIEPWLYGQSMGVSEIALLVSAAFWAFLWGPIGLVLSSPLTVCLVMLGRYVPQLEFLAVLLGDEPALELKDSFYQRLLARDQDEAEDLILERLKAAPPDEIFDTMLVPALCVTRQSFSRGEITEADEQAIMQSLGEIVEDLGEIRGHAASPPEESREESPAALAEAPSPCLIYGCPARDAADHAALQMLEKLLDSSQWRMKLIAPETLTSELLEMVAIEAPALVCIAALPPGGLAHTRYLCKRLDRAVPRIEDRRRTLGRGIRCGKPP